MDIIQHLGFFGNTLAPSCFELELPLLCQQKQVPTPDSFFHTCFQQTPVLESKFMSVSDNVNPRNECCQDRALSGLWSFLCKSCRWQEQNHNATPTVQHMVAEMQCLSVFEQWQMLLQWFGSLEKYHQPEPKINQFLQNVVIEISSPCCCFNLILGKTMTLWPRILLTYLDARTSFIPQNLLCSAIHAIAMQQTLIAVIADHKFPAVTSEHTHHHTLSWMYRLTFIAPSCLVQIHDAENHTQSIPVTRLAQLFLSAWIHTSFFIVGQYLPSHCYIKLQYLKRADLLLWMDATAASRWMSHRMTEIMTEMQLKASYLSFSVDSSNVSPPLACLGWVQLSTRMGHEMTSQLLASEWLHLRHWKPRLSLSLSPALGLFLFPQQSAEVSKIALKTSNFQITGAHTSQSWTICRKHEQQRRKYPPPQVLNEVRD